MGKSGAALEKSFRARFLSLPGDLFDGVDLNPKYVRLMKETLKAFGLRLPET